MRSSKSIYNVLVEFQEDATPFLTYIRHVKTMLSVIPPPYSSPEDCQRGREREDERGRQPDKQKDGAKEKR